MKTTLNAAAVQSRFSNPAGFVQIAVRNAEKPLRALLFAVGMAFIAIGPAEAADTSCPGGHRVKALDCFRATVLSADTSNVDVRAARPSKTSRYLTGILVDTFARNQSYQVRGFARDASESVLSSIENKWSKTATLNEFRVDVTDPVTGRSLTTAIVQPSGVFLKPGDQAILVFQDEDTMALVPVSQDVAPALESLQVNAKLFQKKTGQASPKTPRPRF